VVIVLTGGGWLHRRHSSSVLLVSIATFKRQLGRLPGVENVGVSSGPDGEFIFTVGHGSDASLSSPIPTCLPSRRVS
jgi:hypothetical protein